MANFPVIDTDGHVLERHSDIRKYMEEPWIKRPTPLWPGDQPWDNDMMDSFEMAREWKGLGAASKSTAGTRSWIVRCRESDLFPPAPVTSRKTRKCRIKSPLHARPIRSSPRNTTRAPIDSLASAVADAFAEAAAEELRRAVTQLGLKGFEILPTGLPLALGDPFYDPIYEEAERLGVVLGIHGTRNTSRELGTRDWLHSPRFTPTPSPLGFCCNSPASYAKACRSAFRS
jgi:hypothetical protein